MKTAARNHPAISVTKENTMPAPNRFSRLWTAAFAALLLLPPLFPAFAPASEPENRVTGVWLLEAVNDKSLASFSLEIKIAGELEPENCTLTFLKSGVAIPAKTAKFSGDVLEIVWEFEATNGPRIMSLSGPIVGRIWRGDYLFSDADGKRIGGGTFSGERNRREKATENRDFSGVWIGHYGNHGERFRIRFELKNDQDIITGAAVMPDEGIEAKVTDVRLDGDSVALVATWEVPALDINARVEFNGTLRNNGWSGTYTVFPEGGRQAMGGGRFAARRPPGHSGGQPAAAVIDNLARPAPNGLLAGSWNGFYKSDGREYGARVEIGIVNDRYIGTLFLPDDRMEATLFFVSDDDGVGIAIGSVETTDANGDPETITLTLEGPVENETWRGSYQVQSPAIAMEGPFHLVRR